MNDLDFKDIDQRIKELEAEKRRKQEKYLRDLEVEKESKQAAAKQADQPKNNEYIKKKVAALEVINWLGKAKLMAMLAIILPFITLVLDLLFIFGSLAVIAAVTVLVGFMLFKIEKRRRALIYRYGLQRTAKKMF